MKSEREVFTEALEITEASARTEYLNQVCGHDSQMRQRLDDLLRHHDSVDSVLEKRPLEVVESVSHGGDVSDVTIQGPDAVLSALQPYLEPPTQEGALGRLSHYELLEVLGQGGYGTVFKAFDTRLNRMVAIKILSPLLAATSPPRRRFLREARAAAAVRHENVVQIYGVEESPIPYLVMEFISGETLQQRSERLGPFDPAEVIRFGQQIAHGLAAAHAKGLVHRDIKPGNILIDDSVEPRAKLSDFGLARTVDDASTSQSGIVVGTPMYMSPEQVRGDEIDQRADLFSLGSVLYLMATGRPPFRAPTTLAVLKRVVEDRPRSIRDIIPDLPKGLGYVISRLHAKQRDERFSTARDVESALGDCLQHPRRFRWKEGAAGRRAANRMVAAIALLLVCTTGVIVSESLGWTQMLSGTRASDSQPGVELAAKSKSAPALIPVTGDEPAVIAAANPAAERNVTSPVASKPGPELAEKTGASAEIGGFELTDWDRAVISMSPEDQATTVRAKLCQLNPQLDPTAVKISHDGGPVHSLVVDPSGQLEDISPLRALRELKVVRFLNGGGGRVSDLSPLQGLPLTILDIVSHPIKDLAPLQGMPLRTLGLWEWVGDDLSPLRGMQLVHANLGGQRILRNLEPLRGMPLEMLCLNYNSIEDLSPLAGMPLQKLEIQNTKVTNLLPIVSPKLLYLGTQGSPVTDFSPLKNTQLNELTLDYNAARDEAAVRSIPALRTVNGRPLAEFLANP